MISKTLSAVIRYSVVLCLMPLASSATPENGLDQSDKSQSEWNRFRGFNGQGVVEAASVPVQWDANSVAWKTTLPGTGHSSPVVWQNHVYVTYSIEQPLQGVVASLDTVTGRILWKTSYLLKKSRLNSLNNVAGSTPAMDADHLYVLWPSEDKLVLTALAHNGEKKWSQNFGHVNSRHGICVSPVVYHDLVIFSQEQYEKNTALESRWLAVDRRNGDIRWELKRSNRSPSYITPCLYTDPTGQDQLIFTSQAHGMTAIAPDTGRVLWELPDVCPDRTVGSPVLADHCIIAASGAGGGGRTLAFVQPGTKHTPPKVLHSVENKLIPYTPTMLVLKDRLFAFRDSGTLACWDIQSGTPLWSESLKHKFHGSPIAAGDHLYCISTKGDVIVVQAGDTYQPLAINPLGEKSHATPAVAGNRLFLRTLSTLTCVTGPH